MPSHRITTVVFLLVYAVLSLWGVGRLAVASNFGDTWRGATLPDMVAGTAERPYVYRALVPAVVGAIVWFTPDSIQQSANAALAPLKDSAVLQSLAVNKPFLSDVFTQTDTFYLRLVAMLVMYAGVIGYMAAMYKLGKELFPRQRAAVLFLPVIGMFFIPALATKLAYIYDIAVLALASACYYALLVRQWRWYYVWLILACINKETAIFTVFFFALWSYPLMPRREFATHLTIQAALFLFIRGFIMFVFSDNPGVFLKTDYWQAHLSLLLQGYDYTFLVTLAAGTFLLMFRFQDKPLFARKGLWVFALAYLSYIVFGKPEEYRVFYEAVPFLAALVTHTLVATTGLQELPCFQPRELHE